MKNSGRECFDRGRPGCFHDSGLVMVVSGTGVMCFGVVDEPVLGARSEWCGVVFC